MSTRGSARGGCHEATLSTDLADDRRIPAEPPRRERVDIEAMLREMRAKVKLARGQTAQLREDEQAVLMALT